LVAKLSGEGLEIEGLFAALPPIPLLIVTGASCVRRDGVFRSEVRGNPFVDPFGQLDGCALLSQHDLGLPIVVFVRHTKSDQHTSLAMGVGNEIEISLKAAISV